MASVKSNAGVASDSPNAREIPPNDTVLFANLEFVIELSGIVNVVVTSNSGIFILIFDSHKLLVFLYKNSLSVAPLNNKPPLVAVTSVGEVTLPNIINLSSTWICSALIALILPVTFKFPNTFKFALIVVLLVVVIAPSFNNTFSIVTPVLFEFSLIISTDRVPLISTVPVWPSTRNPVLPLFFASKLIQLIPPEPSITVLVPTLKLVALTICASTSLSFNITPSIVTPVLFEFSLIISTDRVPLISTVPVWPSTRNPVLPLFFASKLIQLIPPEPSITVLVPTLKLVALTICASTSLSFNITLSIVTPLFNVFSVIVSTNKEEPTVALLVVVIVVNVGVSVAIPPNDTGTPPIVILLFASLAFVTWESAILAVVTLESAILAVVTLESTILSVVTELDANWLCVIIVASKSSSQSSAVEESKTSFISLTFTVLAISIQSSIV